MKSLVESILDSDVMDKTDNKVAAKLKDFQNMNKISDEVKNWAEGKLHCKFEEVKLDPNKNAWDYKIDKANHATRYRAIVPNMSVEYFKKQKSKYKKLFDQIGSKLGFVAGGYTHRSAGNTVMMNYQDSEYVIQTPCSISTAFDSKNMSWCVCVTIIKYDV